MHPQESNTRQQHPRLVLALWVICLIGLLIRGWLVDRLYPMTAGDPLYFYTYRATLIAAGQWEGVYLMWHPPGYPLLLGGLTAASGGLLKPYWCGVGLSLMSYLGLFWIIDRLVSSRVQYGGTRLVVGSFVALYETLFLWATSPLTEPVYLFLIYGAVLILDRERLSAVRALVVGFLLGVAFTVRMEAAAPALGLGLYLVAKAWRVNGWIRATLWGGLFGLGWLGSSGWLLANIDYLRICVAAQQASYTIPPAQGLGGHVVRAVECAYHATTIWLPFALLAPYWLAAGAGLTHRANAPGRPVLHPLLLAVILPSLVAVGWTIMHKRTASFLLPGAAIWVGFGVESLAVRWLGLRSRWVSFALGVAILANVIQAARVGFFLSKEQSHRDAPDYVASAILRDHAAVAGPVWAFGSEPDVYALLGWPVLYTFFDRDLGYNEAYTHHVGEPPTFVNELRRRGFQYLVFALKPKPNGDQIEKQTFTGFGPPPRRTDLEQIATHAEQLGLDQLGAQPADVGRTLVYVFRIR